MVTSTDTVKDFEQLIVRLERNHQCVLRLSKNLNSYKYEPRNYECFVELRELKSSFADLALQQRTLFDAIQNQSLKFSEAIKRVDESISQFQRLEQVMAKYLLSL